MLRELDAAHLTRIEPLCSAPYLSLVVRAIIAGNARERVWVDSPETPRAALLWDGGHCLWLAGDGRASPFVDLLPDLLGEIASETAAANLRYFKVAPADSSWDDVLHRAMPEMRRRERLLLRLGPRDSLRQSPAPPGFRGEPIDRALLENTDPGSGEFVRAEIAQMWPSAERFLSRGFGTVIRRDDAVVCWCTTEYVGEGSCGIGIETLREFQGQGLATAAAGAVLAECRARGLTAYWDCWADNRPSRRVAEKVGFAPLCGYHVYFGETLRLATHGAGR